MSDTSTAVSAMQSWMSTVQTTMDNLPSEMEAAVPTGNFASVLANVQAVFASPTALPAQASTTSAPTGATLQPQFSDPSASSTATPTGAQVVAGAAQYLGVPYVWGGSTPSGFDCSGLVQYVYGQLGVTLPRTSQEQVNVGTPVASLADAEPGDLVFFAGSDGTDASPGHVGIYIGNGEMIDAPETGETVSVQPVGDPVAIRQILPDTPAVSTTSPTTLTSAALTAAATPNTASPTTPSAVPSALAPLFVAAAGRYNVPATLLTAVSRAESNFNPNAVSSAGAEGLMQLMPSTAAGLGVNPFDPAQAIDGAAQLLSGYLQQFGSVPLALAAYNAGPAAVEQYGGVPPYPQTQAYVQSITQSLQGTS